MEFVHLPQVVLNITGIVTNVLWFVGFIGLICHKIGKEIMECEYRSHESDQHPLSRTLSTFAINGMATMSWGLMAGNGMVVRCLATHRQKFFYTPLSIAC